MAMMNLSLTFSESVPLEMSSEVPHLAHSTAWEELSPSYQEVLKLLSQAATTRSVFAGYTLCEGWLRAFSGSSLIRPGAFRLFWSCLHGKPHHRRNGEHRCAAIVPSLSWADLNNFGRG